MEDILKKINSMSDNTMISILGIEFTELGEDYICGTMPVNNHSKQPMGLLHGGASVALAETLGSVGSVMKINQQTHMAVGLEINANHLRPVKEGIVNGKATLIHQGSKTHIWNIEIKNQDQKLVCISRLTMAILEKNTL
jgi:1,4-dihydroxy-2-naphthoyl-CoA hydrolase